MCSSLCGWEDHVRSYLQNVIVAIIICQVPSMCGLLEYSTGPKGRQCCYPHFTDQKNEARGVLNGLS